MKRSDFDSAFRLGSPLRQSAEAIARLSSTQHPSFVGRPHSPEWPYNFLANAEVSGTWRRPPAYWPTRNLSLWKAGISGSGGALTKQQEHGFDLNRCIGLSLLFDPFVDGFLAAHLQAADKIPPGCTVLVLSDYYPLPGCIGPTTAGDWGLDETVKTLRGIVDPSDRTTPKLFDCLFGGEWRNNKDWIIAGIREKKLLLWNFLPMFRGGSSATSAKGIPPRNHPWVLVCWDLLAQFVQEVQALKVVLMCSRKHIDLPRSGSKLPSTSITLPKLGRLPSLPACVTELWRLNHPYSWGLGRCPNECTILQGII